MEIIKNEQYSVVDSSINTIPGMIIGIGSTKEEAVKNFLMQVKRAQKMCYKNIELLDSIIEEANNKLN